MKLLICDDDISTVDVIQSQLDCGELGITRILRAYNGDAAIRLIDRERPEIILCDIGMPRRSGIEVLKYIHEKGYETEFCFLTCHEDFAYAKAAIQYGARNYITKPFAVEELKTAVQGMASAAGKKRDAMRLAGQPQRDSVLNNVLRQISYGTAGTSPDSVESVLRRNGLSLSPLSRWYMVMLCADLTDAIQSVWDRELLLYTVGRLHDEVLASYIGSAYSMTDYDGRFLRCTGFVPAENCGEAELTDRCHTMLALCAEHFSLRPSILVSGAFPLHRAARIREEMAGKLPRLRVHTGKIFSMEEIGSSAGDPVRLLDTNQILLYLKRHDRKGCMEYISFAVRQAGTSGEYTRAVLDDFRRELVNIFLSCLRDNGISSRVLFEDGVVTGLNTASIPTQTNLLRLAERLFVLTEEALRDLVDADDIIAKADAYIREHFRENINREDVAAVACITPNYLSKQFRSKKGMNLREYINKIRIDEAKRLLLSTNLPVSEIAGMTGYDNISYFSTVFRKHVGMSPVDWRLEKGGADREA